MTSVRAVRAVATSALLVIFVPAIAQAAPSRDDDDDRPPPSVSTVPAHRPGASANRRDADPVQPGHSSLMLPAPKPAGAPNSDDDDDKKPVAVTEVVVTARRLDTARAAVEPSVGASTYTITNDTVENRPGGESTNPTQILLQAPGVAQGGNGQLSVRSQGDLQYRINNVIVADCITDLGDSLSAHLVDRVQLVIGALQGQYGLHAGGVVNITTKSSVFDRGGQAELYGGRHSEIEPAFEYGGLSGSTNFFVSGCYLHNNVGLNSRDGSADPTHDQTNQLEGFALVDHIIDAQTRISLIVGGSNERFQRPGVGDLPSTFVDASDGHQTQNAQYGLLSLLRMSERLTVQLSAFTRVSRLDDVADPISPGISQSAKIRALFALLRH